MREAYGRHSNTAYVVAPSAVGSFKLGAPRLVDDGGYQPAADPEFERRRVTVAHRIEYLASQE